MHLAGARRSLADLLYPPRVLSPAGQETHFTDEEIEAEEIRNLSWVMAWK